MTGQEQSHEDEYRDAQIELKNEQRERRGRAANYQGSRRFKCADCGYTMDIPRGYNNCLDCFEKELRLQYPDEPQRLYVVVHNDRIVVAYAKEATTLEHFKQIVCASFHETSSPAMIHDMFIGEMEAGKVTKIADFGSEATG